MQSDSENAILLDCLLHCIAKTMPKFRARTRNANLSKSRIKAKEIDTSLSKGVAATASAIKELTERVESFFLYGIRRCPNIYAQIGDESIRKIQVYFS